MSSQKAEEELVKGVSENVECNEIQKVLTSFNKEKIIPEHLSLDDSQT